jgi:hypothetical protein
MSSCVVSMTNEQIQKTARRLASNKGAGTAHDVCQTSNPRSKGVCRREKVRTSGLPADARPGLEATKSKVRKRVMKQNAGFWWEADGLIMESYAAAFTAWSREAASRGSCSF